MVRAAMISYGFQIWDVEVADDIRKLVSRHDGPVSFMQMLSKPVASDHSGNRISGSHPLLAICADGSFSGDTNVQDGLDTLYNVTFQQRQGSFNDKYVPTVVWFYSLRSQSYVHLLRFRSAVLVVRCSSRIVAVLQSAQIHCLNAATLEKEYTILTNPVPSGCYGSADIGLGPLAVGPRWMAYSGSQVTVTNSGRVMPQHLSSSPSFPSPPTNVSLVAHYAKESSKHLAAGIVTLGDMGYKKLSSYYTEQLPEGKRFQTGTPNISVNGMTNGQGVDAESLGMVVVRDIVSKGVICQFRAHKSPISSLCFDPSGVLLVTASIQGHNINVFRIMPRLSGESRETSGPTYVHLYRLQRGLTNAVIRDISFSSDSRWILISSSRGTNHLFGISPSGGMVSSPSNNAYFNAQNSHTSPNSGLQVLKQQQICTYGPPVTLSAVSRIRSGNNSWKKTVSGAASAATGKSSSVTGAIASAFYTCNANDVCRNNSPEKYYFLVFSQSGSVTQHALHISPAFYSTARGNPDLESNLNSDVGVTVEAIQKWNICQKQNRKDWGDNIDSYGENGNADNSKVHPERAEITNGILSDILNTGAKEKIAAEERNNMYISEAELQMHENANLLWFSSETCFQCMLAGGIDEEDAGGGEIEIERNPVRGVEARSKGLVPVLDFIQTTKSLHGRISGIDRNNEGDNNRSRSSSSARKGSAASSLEYVGSVNNNEYDDGGAGDASGFVNKTVIATPPPTVSSLEEDAECVNNNNNNVNEEDIRCVQNDRNRNGLKMKMEQHQKSNEFG
ncbi:autophagy-related protein 18f-like isoform X2 [Andrographis paniculata]|uniref:autophagy-related protein 18f-like isoform X2 n=1 Tax=Andrographis paniculata TaxID=175694 RepID=UPI0021E952BF|nr:autophagy-related protein 18f-like isoform X2 [Andrographis paniculata]